MKTTEIVHITYAIELTADEQKKFNLIPFGWTARKEGTEIPLLSEMAWNRFDSWKPLSDPFFLNKAQYDALVEYLNK